MPSYNQKQNLNGQQKRKHISFYDEISQPYYEIKAKPTNSESGKKPTDKNSTTTKERNQRIRFGHNGTESNFSQKQTNAQYLIPNILSTNEEKKSSKNLFKFYLIAGVFVIVCILSAVMFNNCSSSLNAQDEELNNEISAIESEVNNGVVEYNQTLSQNLYKELDELSYPKVLSTLSELDSSENSVSYTGEKQPSQDNKNKLEAEVNKIVKTDEVDLSFCAIDILSQNCVYYNIDQKGKTFSSIKGPFLSADACQIDGFVTKHDEQLYQAIKFSENNPYDTLWKKYGTSYMQNWLNELNITDSLEGIGYPEHFRVRSMAKLWAKMFMEFNYNESIASFVSYFTHTKNSAIDLELGDEYLVQSKAGWGDGTENYTGTNDCGIVYSNQRPYILCIFSGYNNHPSKLQDLVRCIDNCHNDIIQ